MNVTSEVWARRAKVAITVAGLASGAAVLIFSTAVLIVVSGRQEVLEVIKKQEISNTELVTAVFGVTVLAVLTAALLVTLARWRRSGKSTAYLLVEKWSAARADRKSRRDRTEADMRSLRNRIVRETYAQVLEQQERGLLCPNCKGQAPGHGKGL